MSRLLDSYNNLFDMEIFVSSIVFYNIHYYFPFLRNGNFKIFSVLKFNHSGIPLLL